MTVKTLATALEELRTALEAKQVVHQGVHDFEGDPPGKVGTQVYVPDPQYAHLLGLVRHACPGVKASLKFDAGEEALSIEEACDAALHRLRPCELGCRDTGFITSTVYWERAPEGALEGALVKVLFAMWRKDEMSNPPSRVWSTAWEVDRICWDTGDTRIEAATAVLAWVKEQP